MTTTRRGTLAAVIAIGLGGLFATAIAAPTDEQRCEAAKLRALAKHYLCRQKEEASALLQSRSPDFSACDARIQVILDALESRFPGGGPALGCRMDSIHVRSELLNAARRDAGDMTCRLTNEKRVRRVERPGSLVFVDFATSTGTTLALRHTSNAPVVHAQCFYVSRDGPCVGSSEFVVDVPTQSEVSWPASTGAGAIPPVPAGISAGLLVCLEIDDSGVPILGNRLIASVRDQEWCAQDGVPIQGLGIPFPTAIFNLQLCLGTATSVACPVGAEYEPCPYLFDAPLKPRIESCWNTLSSFTFHCQ